MISGPVKLKLFTFGNVVPGTYPPQGGHIALTGPNCGARNIRLMKIT